MIVQKREEFRRWRSGLLLKRKWGKPHHKRVGGESAIGEAVFKIFGLQSGFFRGILLMKMCGHPTKLYLYYSEIVVEIAELILHVYRLFAFVFFLYLVFGSLARGIALRFGYEQIRKYTLSKKWVILCLAVYWIKIQIFFSVPDCFFIGECPDSFVRADVVGTWVKGEQYIRFQENGDAEANYDLANGQTLQEAAYYPWNFDTPDLFLKHPNEHYRVRIFTIGGSVRIAPEGDFGGLIFRDYGFKKVENGPPLK